MGAAYFWYLTSRSRASCSICLPGRPFYTVPASELDNWVKAAAPLFDDFTSDMDKKGLPGKQMLQDARDLLVKYQK